MRRPSSEQRLHGAWLDAVEDGVVPISVKARNFALRVEAQEIGVGNEHDLRLLCDAGYIRWYRPAHHGLDYDRVSFGKHHLDHFDLEIGDGLRKGAPDAVEAAPNRHEAVSAIGSVSSLCIISAKSEHAFDVMSVIGGEKLFGDGFHIFVVFHVVSACEALPTPW